MPRDNRVRWLNAGTSGGSQCSAGEVDAGVARAEADEMLTLAKTLRKRIAAWLTNIGAPVMPRVPPTTMTPPTSHLCVLGLRAGSQASCVALSAATVTAGKPTPSSAGAPAAKSMWCMNV